MNIKDVFDKSENGTLTLAEFEAIAKSAKFADLSEGGYVSKGKYDDDLGAKDKQIADLNGTIATRDIDLADLQKRLGDAGVDQTKLAEVSKQLSDLQTQYDADTKNYQDKLSKQAYEFAVKEFAGTQKFTSPAAKRDFVSSMLAKELIMEGSKILGADDFLKTYASENAESFVVEKAPEPEAKPTPHFVGATGKDTPPQTDKNAFQFNFTGVRPKED